MKKAKAVLFILSVIFLLSKAVAVFAEQQGLRAELEEQKASLANLVVEVQRLIDDQAAAKNALEEARATYDKIAELAAKRRDDSRILDVLKEAGARLRAARNRYIEVNVALFSKRHERKQAEEMIVAIQALLRTVPSRKP